MEDLGIEFSKIFLKKHGNRAFKNITNQIKSECGNNCNSNYINAIFTIAFLTYIGVFDKKRICILGGISKDENIEDLKKIHKNSIFQIQKYIQATNEQNFKDIKK
uniref:hypothetical protein n=1 Tax=Candidatus Merdicola sp. TaxID=3085652 RepID=UPI003FEFB428